MITPPLHVCWIVIAICNIFSIFYSMADMVYSVADVEKLTPLANQGDKKAKIAIKLAKDYEFSIASILFGNNIANILASSMVTVLGTMWNKSWGAIVSTIIFTACLILIAEFLPKALAKRFNFSLSLYLAYPTLISTKITFIIVYPISKLFSVIGKAFKKKSIEEDVVDEEILDEMVDSLQEQGELDKDEAQFVKGAIDLVDIQAFEIMTPRVEILALDINEIKDNINNPDIYKYSRIPVYEDSIDNIIGILSIKSIIKSKNNNDVDYRKLCFEPLRIPRNYQILDLLKDFKSTKTHVAIVIDEYGGTDGIITMEDILEEIVGDIFDEQDEIDEEIISEKDGVYIVDGNLNIYDFFELIGYEKEFETDYSTVNGFVQEILHRFGKTGDTFTFANKYQCKILKANKYTIEKLKVVNVKEEK